MNQPMPGIAFRGMAFLFKLRDLLVPRSKVLHEVGIKPGDTVLDFGCGPGAYVPDTANAVGPSGKVYALDLHPLAVASVAKMAKRQGLDNVVVIQSDRETGLPPNSVDVVLLQDTLHLLEHSSEVLAELCRVLKPMGVLALSDHHMREDEILTRMAQGGLFRLQRNGRRTYRFVKSGPAARTHRPSSAE
jgi:ubiquinone/menaquinone biosynthesis C-methylase UbiE